MPPSNDARGFKKYITINKKKVKAIDKINDFFYTKDFFLLRKTKS